MFLLVFAYVLWYLVDRESLPRVCKQRILGTQSADSLTRESLFEHCVEIPCGSCRKLIDDPLVLCFSKLDVSALFHDDLGFRELQFGHDDAECFDACDLADEPVLTCTVEVTVFRLYLTRFSLQPHVLDVGKPCSFFCSPCLLTQVEDLSSWAVPFVVLGVEVSKLLLLVIEHVFQSSVGALCNAQLSFQSVALSEEAIPLVVQILESNTCCFVCLDLQLQLGVQLHHHADEGALREGSEEGLVDCHDVFSSEG